VTVRDCVMHRGRSRLSLTWNHNRSDGLDAACKLIEIC